MPWHFATAEKVILYSLQCAEVYQAASGARTARRRNDLETENDGLLPAGGFGPLYRESGTRAGGACGIVADGCRVLAFQRGGAALFKFDNWQLRPEPGHS